MGCQGRGHGGRGGASREQGEPSDSAGVQGRLPRGRAAERGLKVGPQGRIPGEGCRAGLKAWTPGGRGIQGPIGASGTCENPGPVSMAPMLVMSLPCVRAPAGHFCGPASLAPPGSCEAGTVAGPSSQEKKLRLRAAE